MQALFSSLCRKWGFHWIGVQDSHEAVETVLRERPDLIVLDVQMPGLDGFQVLKLVKADARLADIPVVIMTGSQTDVPSKVAGLSGGAVDYLIKPVDPDELLARIQGYLDRRRQAATLAQEREIQAVRKTATFLNHSINNLLATIQIVAELDAEEGSDTADTRMGVISEKVRSIAEIVQKLKDIRQFITTSYVGAEEMLDIDGSTRPPEGGEEG